MSGQTEKPKRRTQADRIEPRGMNKKAAARYLGCGERQIDQLVEAGKLTALQYVTGGRYYYDRRELELVIEGARATVPAIVPAHGVKRGLLAFQERLKK